MARIFELLLLFLPFTVALPDDLDQAMYCEGCVATVTELDKLLSNLHNSEDPFEMHVINAMDEVCHRDHFGTYAYIPPKMVKSCRMLLDEFDEDVEKLLMTHPKLEDMEKTLCYELSKACEGVDRSAKPKPLPDTITTHFDGDRQELPVDDQGRVQMSLEEIPPDMTDEEIAEQIRKERAQEEKAKQKRAQEEL
ncbi:uncharacterized protein [Ptychodera flava]|uniref:uncharacterized protein n=1 Tax=Ptychodera flava TaxID=63121 RepID=UPI00396A0828